MRTKTAKKILKDTYGGGELITTISPEGIYKAEIHGYWAMGITRKGAIRNLAKEAIHDKQFKVEVL